MSEEHADLGLEDDDDDESSSFSSRIKALLPLLRAQALVGGANPTTRVDFVRKVESPDEASRIVREMETRAGEAVAHLVATTAAYRNRNSRGDVVVSDGENVAADDTVMMMSSSSSSSLARPDEQDTLPASATSTATVTAHAAASASASWEPVQLWTKRPIGALPKGGVLALDLPPYSPVQSSRAQHVSA